MPASTLTKAFRATVASGSFRLTIGGSFDVAGQGFPIDGAGGVDARKGRARASLDLTKALAASGVSSIAPDEARADAVVIGSALYVRSPYLVRRRHLRRPWVRYPLRRAIRVVGPVKRLGTDTIDGVATTHYSSEVDVGDYARAVPVDVWVDSADRIRRVVAQVGTPRYQALPQVDIGGFGRPVVVSPPAPALVADAR